MLSSFLPSTGSENMEGFDCRGRGGFSSIVREVINRSHNESTSIGHAEGFGGAPGVRGHSTGETLEGGRSGGG